MAQSLDLSCKTPRKPNALAGDFRQTAEPCPRIPSSADAAILKTPANRSALQLPWVRRSMQSARITLRTISIRARPAELEAFRAHQVIVFVLAAGNASAAETAELITRLYDKIQRLAAQAKPPVMVSVTRSGISKPIKFK
ncbi:hypothetical protein [Thiobacillus sp.]|uniref:hypothetical protein n=1 Tax=Thiobacillus sp. TaxID=924 RepID=UPI00286DDDDF|nr:hypothetical protein [Thiobacillus sp.]